MIRPMAIHRDQISNLYYASIDLPGTIQGYKIDYVLSGYGYKSFDGPKGIGFYTLRACDGFYYVFYARPSGPGLRTGNWAHEYTLVTRLTTRRKSKKSAINRAYQLAHGKSRQPLEPSKPKAENHPNTGYCLHCKIHVIVETWHQVFSSSGRAMLEAWCTNCDKLENNNGTRITKFGVLIDCPQCEKMQPESKGDYLCKVCRWEENADSTTTI